MVRTTERAQRRCLTSGGKALRILLPALLSASVLAIAVSAPAGAKAPRVHKPGPPKAVTAAPIDGGATVSWTAPNSDGGSPITGYTATAYSGANCSTSGATTCTITGLTNGQHYDVTVRATNIAGTGRASAVAKVVAGQGPNCDAVGPGVDLQYCSLGGHDLNSADLAGANMFHVRLVDGMVNDADLDNADLQQADIDGGSLEGATLTSANLTSAYLGYADLDGADLTDAVLNNANFTYTDLVNATLTGSDMNEANPNTLANIAWGNTTCPDGTNSNADGDTCLNNLG